MRSTPWAHVIIFAAAGRGGSKGIDGLADPVAYRLIQGQERLPGARPPLDPVRHRGYSQVLPQLPGVLLAHALQRRGELSRDNGSQPLAMLGEIHHVPARGITGRTGHSRRSLDGQLAHDVKVTGLEPAGRPSARNPPSLSSVAASTNTRAAA